MNVNKFNIEPNLPKKITSFSVIDKQIQPSLLHAIGWCLIFDHLFAYHLFYIPHVHHKNYHPITRMYSLPLCECSGTEVPGSILISLIVSLSFLELYSLKPL